MSLYTLESLARAGASSPDHGEWFFTRYSPLTLHDGRGGFQRTDAASLGAVGVARVVSSGHDVSVEEADCVTVLAPLRGRIRSATARGVFDAGAGGAIVFWPNRRDTRVEPGATAAFRAAALRLPAATLRAAAEGLERAGARRLAAADLSVALDPARAPGTGMLTGYLGALLDELDREDSLLRDARARARAERQIAEMLVETLEAAGLLPEPAGATDATARRRVDAALAFMRAEYASIVSVTEVATAAGLSARALQLAFRSARADTPRAALAAIRLEAARARLAAPDDPASVSAVALDCGFTHLGRFATAYRARFGEAPSVTLGRAQAVG